MNHGFAGNLEVPQGGNHSHPEVDNLAVGSLAVDNPEADSPEVGSHVVLVLVHGHGQFVGSSRAQSDCLSLYLGSVDENNKVSENRVQQQ